MRWLACVALGGAVLLLPFAGLGVSAATLVATCAFVVLFIALPGLALLVHTRWMTGDPLVFAAWCAAAGLVLQPLWLTPLWMAGSTGLAWIVPLASIAAVVPAGGRLTAWLGTAMRARPLGRWLARVAGLAAFTAFSACLGIMHPFATTPIDPHFATQGSIVRNLMDGWPPMNQLLEGVPLSYNYGVHLGLMLLAGALHADLVQVVSRVAPVLFLEAATIAFIGFGRSVLGLGWTALVLAAIAVFWVVGFGPVNSALYGSVLPSASVYVVSSSAAFVVFFVALRFLADDEPRGWLAAGAGIGLGFALTAMRGQGAPVWLAVAAFASVLPLARERRLDGRALAILGGSILGVLLGLRIFFTLGAGFSGTSFLQVGTTFGWLAEQNAFTLVEALQRHGIGAWGAGAAGFALIALMQSKFLAPAFVHAACRLRVDSSRALLLVAATALAGTCATMLTRAPGGSHFSFLHYATLAMALLGAAGVEQIMGSGEPRATRAKALLALMVALALASAWDLAHQLRRFEGRWLAGAPVLHAMPGVDPLLDRIPAEAVVLPLLRAADQVPGIEAEWGMLRGLRFAIYSSLLREYAGWENRLAPELRRRVAAATGIEQALAQGRLDATQLEAAAATLSRAQPLYVIAPASASARDPRLHPVASTKAYTLYFFQPTGRSGP